jgi:hypothetical protein
MQTKAIPRSPECEGESTQGAVLALVLSEHPAVLAIYEIARELGNGGGAEQAVDDLVGVGLLRCEGASVLPTRAALHFDRLAA